MGAAPPSEGARCFRTRRAVRGLDCVGGPSRQPRGCGEPLINLAEGCAGYQQTRLQSKSSFCGKGSLLRNDFFFKFFRSRTRRGHEGRRADGRGARGGSVRLCGICAELLENVCEPPHKIASGLINYTNLENLPLYIRHGYIGKYPGVGQGGVTRRTIGNSCVGLLPYLEPPYTLCDDSLIFFIRCLLCGVCGCRWFILSINYFRKN